MSCQWLKQRLKKPAGLLRGPVLMVLLLAAVACSAEATATPAPTPAQTEAPTATAEPTTVPKPTPTPTVEIIAEPDDGAMAFADYWNPPTDYYGNPVYGDTLRINYEDPLEHANVWGAASGVTDMCSAAGAEGQNWIIG